MVVGRSSKAEYWSQRRSKQWGRFGGKLGGLVANPSTTNIAKAAWSGVKYLRTLVNSEVFKIDSGPTSQAVSTTATIVNLVPIAQGDGNGARTGTSVLANYLAIKLFCTIHASATQSLLRIIFFVDKQQVSDTSPATTDLLTTNSTLSFLNNNAAGRFIVLKDYFVNLDSTGSASRQFKYYKKFKNNMHLKWNGTLSTDIQKNGIYMLMLSSEATNTPTVAYSIRFGYYDN